MQVSTNQENDSFTVVEVWLQKIAQLSEEGKEPLVDFCLFALLGIQISYPTIFRLLNKYPDFPSWNEKLAKQYDIEDLSMVSDDNKFTDDPWEKVLFLICQKDSYLKPRALNIIEILNVLKDECGDELKTHINKALEIASITTVDDHEDSKQTRGVDKELRANNRKYMGKLAKILNEKFTDNSANIIFDCFKATQSHDVEWAVVESQVWIDNTNKISAKIGFAFDNQDYNGHLWSPNKKSGEKTDQLISELGKIYPEMETEKDEEGYVYIFSIDNDNKMKHEDFYSQFESKVLDVVNKISKLGVFKTK